MTRRQFGFLSIVGLATLAGCGGGGGGTPADPPPPTTTFVRAQAIVSATGEPRIKLTWGAPTTVVQSKVSAYQIYRDGELVGLGNLVLRTFTDLPIGGTITYAVPGPTITWQDKSVSAMTSATPHRYRVTLVAGDTAVGFTETYLIAGETISTAVAQPVITTTAVAWTLGTAYSFLFDAVQGADRYVVEFSRTPDFATVQRFGPINFTPSGATQSCDLFQNLDLSGRFPGLVAGDVLYYRVGARNDQDSPDENGQPLYLYSTSSVIQAVAPPPGP